jgi:hypothetical protein
VTYQAEIVFSIRLYGAYSDVSIREATAMLAFHATIRPTDYANLEELIGVESYAPPKVTPKPTQVVCQGWANAALVKAGMDSDWTLDVGGVQPGHIWQAGGWVQVANPLFQPWAFPLLYKGTSYYRPGVVFGIPVRTDYWIVVQPA